MRHKLMNLKCNHTSDHMINIPSDMTRRGALRPRLVSRFMSALTASLTLSLIAITAPLDRDDAHAKPKLIKAKSTTTKSKSKSKPKAKPKAKPKTKPKTKTKTKTIKRAKRPSGASGRSTSRVNRTPTRANQRLRRVTGATRAKTSGNSSAQSKSANKRAPVRSVRRAGSGDSRLIKAGSQRSNSDQAGAQRTGGRSLVNTRTPVNSQTRRSVEERSGQAGRAAQPGSKTVTTTTKTTKTKRVERSSRSSKTIGRSRRRVERRRARRRERMGGRGGFGAPPARGPSNCRPRGGRTMINFGIGTQSVDSDQREVALSIGAGYRAGLLGIAGEAQLASREEEEATLSALRGQFRLYLPAGRCADLYPLIGLSSFHGDRDNTYAIDLGLGADFNIAGSVSLGARYTHSFFAERISDIDNEDVESVNTFIVQIGVYF